MRNSRGVAWAGVIWAIAGLAVLAAAIFWIMRTNAGRTKFETPYQTVLLANGAVYYGKLEGYDTRHPVLTDVFYIVQQQNPDTKEVKNILVKRGKELHAPDRMYLTASQIVFVEPVGPTSKVAQLISEQNASK